MSNHHLRFKTEEQAKKFARQVVKVMYREGTAPPSAILEHLYGLAPDELSDKEADSHITTNLGTQRIDYINAKCIKTWVWANGCDAGAALLGAPHPEYQTWVKSFKSLLDLLETAQLEADVYGVMQ